EGGHHELIAGVLYVVPPPTGPHNIAISNLTRIFIRYLDAHPGAGRLFVPRAAVWRPDWQTWLGPDLFLVTAERLRTTDAGRLDTADLVVEALSAGSATYDRTAKADTYAALGVRELWLVDLERRAIEQRLLEAGRWRVAAERVTAEHINFMATHGRGLVCLSLTERRCDQLGLPMMVSENRAPLGTAFTVSIDARHGIGRGISAVDRATTIRTAIRADATPGDIVSPGHVFPLRARRGGVLVRAGQTEGAVDLARLAGFAPAGVICEILREDGTMARLPDLEEFAARHD